MGSQNDEAGHQQANGDAAARDSSASQENPWARVATADGGSSRTGLVLFSVGLLLLVAGVYIAYFSATVSSTLTYGLLLALLAIPVGRHYAASVDSVELH